MTGDDKARAEARRKLSDVSREAVALLLDLSHPVYPADHALVLVGLDRVHRALGDATVAVQKVVE